MSKYSQEKVDPFLLFESYVSIPEDLFEERLRILKSIYKVLTDDGSTLSAYEMLSKELPKYFDCRLEEVGDLCNNMIKLCSSIGEFARAISLGIELLRSTKNWDLRILGNMYITTFPESSSRWANLRRPLNMSKEHLIPQ